MPRDSHAVKMAIWAPVDWRAFSGIDLYHRGDDENPVSAPVWAGRSGLFRTPLAATCGHGSHQSVFDDFDDAWVGLGGDSGDMILALGADDRFRITNLSGNGDDAAAIAAHADNVFFGFSAGETVINIGTTVTAPNSWRRGLVSNGTGSTPPRLRILRQDAPGSTGLVPTYPAWITDMIVGARGRLSVGDTDDDASTGDPLASTSLEALDIAAHGGAASGLRWGHTDAGHLYWTQPVDATDAGEAITWLSTTFRDNCGASGSENVEQTGVSSDDVFFQVFDYPDPHLVLTEWPVEVDDVTFKTDQRQTAVTGDGRQFARAWRHELSHRISFRIDGPADSKDWSQHYVRRLMPRIARRGPLWIVQDWGESRIAAERGDYSLLHTPEFAGDRGRFAVDIRGDIETSIRWLDGLKTSALVTLDVVEAG